MKAPRALWCLADVRCCPMARCCRCPSIDLLQRYADRKARSAHKASVTRLDHSAPQMTPFRISYDGTPPGQPAWPPEDVPRVAYTAIASMPVVECRDPQIELDEPRRPEVRAPIMGVGANHIGLAMKQADASHLTSLGEDPGALNRVGSAATTPLRRCHANSSRFSSGHFTIRVMPGDGAPGDNRAATVVPLSTACSTLNMVLNVPH